MMMMLVLLKPQCTKSRGVGYFVVFVFCLLAVKNNLGTLPSVNFINCILVLTLVCCFLCFRVFLFFFFFRPCIFLGFQVIWSVTPTQLYCYNKKATINNTYMNKVWLCWTPFLWTLQSQIHIIFSCYEILLVFFFSSGHLVYIKPFLAQWWYVGNGADFTHELFN